jgi:hypothetical protein
MKDAILALFGAFVFAFGVLGLWHAVGEFIQWWANNNAMGR